MLKMYQNIEIYSMFIPWDVFYLKKPKGEHKKTFMFLKSHSYR